MRFFKKHMSSHAAKDKVRLPNGTITEFDSLDGLQGWFAVDNPQVEAGLIQMIGEQRGGLTEVSAEEFHAGFVEKKKQGQTLRRVWREEMGKQVTGNTPLSHLGVEAVQAVVADRIGEKPEPPIPAAIATPTSATTAPPEKSEPFIPKTTRKGKSKTQT